MKCLNYEITGMTFKICFASPGILHFNIVFMQVACSTYTATISYKLKCDVDIVSGGNTNGSKTLQSWLLTGNIWKSAEKYRSGVTLYQQGVLVLVPVLFQYGMVLV